MRAYSWSEFHNEVICARRLPNAVFAVAQRLARTEVAPHYHEGASLICLLEGRHQWHGTDGLIHWSIPGAWYARMPNDVHTHEACPTPIKCIGVNFRPEAYGSPNLGKVNAMIDVTEGARIASKIKRELEEPTAGGRYILESALLELIGLFVTTAETGHLPPEHAQLRKAATLLTERFAEPWSLDVLADAIGVHRSHLARLFRRHLGLTVGEYLRDRRLEWAFRQLLATNLKVATIAVEAGFADHAHFCRLFRHRYGLSPTAHREGEKALT